MPAVPAILTAVIMTVIGQLLVKKGLNLLGTINFSTGITLAYIKIFTSPFVIIGILIYTIAIFFWLFGLSKVDLNFAYPFLALSYVLVILASFLILGEHIPPLRWIGVAVICIGILLIAKS